MVLSSLLPNLKAVFFDLDDVLVFSEARHTKAWELSLPQFGIDPKEIDFQSMVGMSDMKQATLFKERFNLKEDAKQLFELKRETFYKLIDEGFESAHGRNQLLEKLAQHYTVAVVSSSVQKVIQGVLNAQKIASFFNFVIGFEDCQHHKPDPTPYFHALAKAGVKPHEALVIEDSFSGISSAQSAAIPVVGLLKDQHPNQIVKGVPYFNNFSEIYNSLFS